MSRGRTIVQEEPVALSDKDRQILGALVNNPRADSPKEIAEATEIPRSTVSKHLRKLRKGGIVATTVRRPHLFPCRALIAMDLDLTHIKGPKYSNQTEFVQFIATGLKGDRQFKRFMEHVNVENVYSLLGGRSDLCAIVCGKDVASIYEFVTRVVHALPGVRNTNTASIAMDIPAY